MRHFVAVLVALVVISLPAAARADVPACTRLAVALVIDRSGSMTGARLENVKAAATAAVEKVGIHDCVTIIAFDSAASTVFPLQTVNDVPTARAAIAHIQAGGGTEILSGLTAARTALLASHAQRRHVIMFTDGQSPVAGMQALAQTMAHEHMTISTIGVGPDIDEPTLRMLAQTASGRFYHVMDPTELSRIFPREIDLAAP